jgi:tetratricopeptide (TPR) repeat protein
MQPDRDVSLSDEATFAGRPRPQRVDVSIGDERTLGDGLAGQETIIDDIEVVDLAARYRIDGTLGQGGMGAVLLATDTRLDRKVAIKRILGEAAGNRMAVNRFLTEAKSIAALNHANIVQIYDYGRAKDGPFLIMEFVDGGSLLDHCRDGAMPLEAAVDMACQLCDGLAKAHDLGIIHRDIKPANVLLTKDGTPKLTDFGLAKSQAGDHGQTMTGAVLGTPDFMAPEQRRDAALVDHRSDLWSLAATIYQMLTGRSPKVIRLHELPQALQGVLAKALEDEKEARYQSVRELRDAIKASLRAAGTAPAAVAAEAGQCPACGVHNDISRKFCRNCGGTLEAPCLSCDKPMPMWEEICGDCGAKQSPLVEQRRHTMAETEAQAEGLLGDLFFDKSAAIAISLRDEPHPRLSQLKGWAKEFLGKVEDAKTKHVSRANIAVAEALKHEQAYDYAACVRALESIPEAVRAVVPGDGRYATVAAMLSDLTDKLAESTSLDGEIRKAVGSKTLSGLLPKVKRLAQLRPDRADVAKVQGQLEERLQRLSVKQAELSSQAQAAFERQDYASAVALFEKIDPELIGNTLKAVGEQYKSAYERSTVLRGEIKSAVAQQRYDGLLGKVDEYLTLAPSSPDLDKLRSLLQKQAERLAAEKQASDARLKEQRRHKTAKRRVVANITGMLGAFAGAILWGHKVFYGGGYGSALDAGFIFAAGLPFAFFLLRMIGNGAALWLYPEPALSTPNPLSTQVAVSAPSPLGIAAATTNALEATALPLGAASAVAEPSGPPSGPSKAQDAFIAILDEELAEFRDTHGHRQPHIPQDKLRKAIAKYGKGLSPGDILLLYDNTSFGSARIGFMLTRQRICWNNDFWGWEARQRPLVELSTVDPSGDDLHRAFGVTENVKIKIDSDEINIGEADEGNRNELTNRLARIIKRFIQAAKNVG